MIPDQAVESAAKHVYEESFGGPWEDEDEGYKEDLRKTQRAALEAAAPYIENPAYHAGVSLAKAFYGKNTRETVGELTLADAWGEGYGAGWNDCLIDLKNRNAKTAANPYKTTHGGA